MRVSTEAVECTVERDGIGFAHDRSMELSCTSREVPSKTSSGATALEASLSMRADPTGRSAVSSGDDALFPRAGRAAELLRLSRGPSWATRTECEGVSRDPRRVSVPRRSVRPRVRHPHLTQGVPVRRTHDRHQLHSPLSGHADVRGGGATPMRSDAGARTRSTTSNRIPRSDAIQVEATKRSFLQHSKGARARGQARWRLWARARSLPSSDTTRVHRIHGAAERSAPQPLTAIPDATTGGDTSVTPRSCVACSARARSERRTVMRQKLFLLIAHTAN